MYCIQIPIFVVGGVTLLATSYLSWILFKVLGYFTLIYDVLTFVPCQVYEKQSFARVGAPSHIHRIYKVSLCSGVNRNVIQ
jgi:hypothetical protein